ncbi:TPA: hypothetical protein DDW35_09800 [Candidatus Sumerlaeota bacterium]|jgi:hypothetical protein|nr:hypothetical protein [Candidatus Sumerlaeota bacterium]
MITISESGMNFGPFDEESCFYIEKSELYLRVKQDAQTAEFLCLHEGKKGTRRILLVEAKSSSPRPETQPNFNEFLDEIVGKMLDSFSLFIAACLGRHEESKTNAIPAKFRELNLGTADFHFVLVIRGHQKRWCVTLQEELYKKLRPTIRKWALSPTAIAVINDADAQQQYGLITQSPNP